MAPVLYIKMNPLICTVNNKHCLDFTHFKNKLFLTWSFISRVLQVDVVVFATGYEYNFSYLPLDLQAKSGHRLCLYKHVFPPTLTRPTLAMVGFIHSFGAINPLSEMQGRWATRVFKGDVLHWNQALIRMKCLCFK